MLSKLLLALALLFLPAIAEVVVHSYPGWSTDDTIREVARNLRLGRQAENGVVFDKSVTLDSSFDDLTLFKYTQSIARTERSGMVDASSTIAVVCVKCYIKGRARTRLTSQGSFNASNVTVDAQESFSHTFQQIEDYLSDTAHQFSSASTNGTDFHLRPPQVDLEIPLPDLPDTQFLVEFDDMELYIALGIKLSSGLTYKLNLYSSEELGVQVQDVFVGAVVSIDLILSVDGDIELDTGFHVKLDGKVSLILALFAKEASQLNFKGGKFEFLPVETLTTTVALKAVLRISVRTGISLGLDWSKPLEVANFTLDDLKLSAGIESSAYANVAELTTNLTTSDVVNPVEHLHCEVYLQRGYQMAVGAAAGASFAILDQTFGPVPSTEIPIFYTTFSTACAGYKTSSASIATTSLVLRGDMVTSTTLATRSYTATQCESAGLINCPASLQSLASTTETETLTTVVPADMSVDWSQDATTTALVSAVAFGEDAVTMTASSGEPVSYKPPPPPTSYKPPPPTSLPMEGGDHKKKPTRVSNKVILGTSIGLGVPVVSAVIVGLVFLRKHRRRNKKTNATTSNVL